MRTILIALAVMFLALFGCSGINHIPASTELRLYDFTKYQSKGFTFTPYGPTGRYESMGFIDLTIYPEMNYGYPEGYVKRKSKISRDHRDGMQWIAKEQELQKALEVVYQKAVSMGANALTDMNISLDKKTHSEKGYHVEIPGIRITGWAVKQ